MKRKTLIDSIKTHEKQASVRSQFDTLGKDGRVEIERK